MPSLENEVVDAPKFKWGKMRATGGKNKSVQFYESFTYDETQFFLYDVVYLYKEGEDPYIGKLVKIFEDTCNKIKKIKVVWFFQPTDIINWLEDDNVSGKELFLASGEGPCMSSINLLEVIIGKCSVLCTSKDERNPQPLDEDLKSADYFFYRTFDVNNCTLSETISDNIAGIEVTNFFNKKVGKSSSDASISEVNKIGEIREPVLCDRSPELLTKLNTLNIQENVEGGGTSAFGTNSLSKETSKALPCHARENSAKSSKEEVVVKHKKDATLAEKKDKVKSSSYILDQGPAKKMRLSDNSSPTREQVLRITEDTRRAQVLNSSNTQENVASDGASGLGKNSLSKDRLKVLPSKGRENSAKSSKEEVVDKHKKIDSLGEKKVKVKSSSDILDQGPRKKMRLSGNLSPTCEEGLKTNEVTERPHADRSKWFKALPWEERLQTAKDQGTLVFLENLDPSYTSGEIEDIIWWSFEEKCSAKMLERTFCYSPHSGQAFVIFKSKEAAATVFRKLNEKCLMLPNARPLVCRKVSPRAPGTPINFVGHLNIDKMRRRPQGEDMRNAVSTSHSSQSNTLEFDMAMEWRLQQEISHAWSRDLFKQQREELQKLWRNLKSKY